MCCGTRCFFVVDILLEFLIHDGDDQAIGFKEGDEGAFINHRGQFFEWNNALHEGQNGEDDEAKQDAKEQTKNATEHPIELFEQGKTKHGANEVGDDGHKDKEEDKAEQEANHVDTHRQDGLVDIFANRGSEVTQR